MQPSWRQQRSDAGAFIGLAVDASHVTLRDVEVVVGAHYVVVL